MSASAERLMPEPLLFATRLLQTFREQWDSRAPTARGWSLQLVSKTKELTAAKVIPLTFDLTANTPCNGADFAASCVNAAVGLIARAVEAYADLPSFPELFAPAEAVLQQLESKPECLPEVVFSVLDLQSICLKTALSGDSFSCPWVRHPPAYTFLPFTSPHQLN